MKNGPKTLQIFEKYQKVVQQIFRSRLLLQIMISLLDGARSLAELRDVTGSSSQSIIPKIRLLEGLHYIESIEEGYILTPEGRILSLKIQDFIHTAALFGKKPDFWSFHCLEAIPAPFLQDIGHLFYSEIIESTDSDIFSVLEGFYAMVENAEWIHVVSSFMSRPHADALIRKIKEGVPVELIIDARIAEELKNEPFRSKIEEILELEHFKVYVVPDPVKIGLTVTNLVLSFGMCRSTDQKYDISSDLFSSDAEAIAWGERLFSWYKESSEEFFL